MILRSMLMIAIAIFFFSCKNQKVMNNSDNIKLFKGVETMLAGYEVICANIANTEYTVENETKEGLTANLALPGAENMLRVGQGSTFSIEGKNWVVVSVDHDGVSVKKQ